MRGPDPGRPLIESHSEPGSFNDSWPVQRLVGIGRGGTSGRPSIFDRNCNSGEPLQMRVTTAEIITLTPQLARRWLASRARQWEADPPHAAALAEQMRAGLWQPGNMIRFEAGRLIDGAHRCHAVLLSGVAIDVVRIDGPT